MRRPASKVASWDQSCWQTDCSQSFEVAAVIAIAIAVVALTVHQ